jgi:hypothetical protein
MSDYRTTDKTEWFIRKMMSGWFSRAEIVDLAASGFPGIARKTLDGTIGQYWSDSVNPKWGTYKAIEARGLKVIENYGRRHILHNVEDSSPLSRKYCAPTPSTNAAEAGSKIGEGNDVAELWNGGDQQAWQRALDRYWSFVKPANLALEREMDQLDAETVRKMDPGGWYKFLLEKYFRWKYTAPNRYVSTTKILRTYASNNELPALHAIKERLFTRDKNNIEQCLAVACSIRGLGAAGASGLLAVLFPAYFGTVDQFAVKALLRIPELPEIQQIAAMHPESLRLDEGALLIRTMRRKAAELNRAFSTILRTPRKVDMILWTCAR